MDDRAKLELEVRLMAIEYAVVHIGAAAFKSLGISPEAARRMSEDARNKLLTETFPGADPAEADHWSAEIADRVKELLTRLSDVLESRPSRSGPPGE